MNKNVFLTLSFLMFGAAFRVDAMVTANRYFPSYLYSSCRNSERQSSFHTRLFFTTGDSAYGDEAHEEKGLYEIWGKYDQTAIGKAITLIGKTDPLQTKWSKMPLVWDFQGKIQSQGLSFAFTKHLFKKWSLGFAGSCMHVTTNQEFLVSQSMRGDFILTAADEIELDRERRLSHDILGLKGNQWSKIGLGDSLLYLRYGTMEEYVLKCRQIDAGIRVGLSIPSGVKFEHDFPSSVPFGSDGFWGALVGVDLALELKEDWIFGIDIDCIKRWSRKLIRRMPILGEPLIFGAVVGNVHIKPGLSFLARPYFRFGDLRDGFGIEVYYAILAHESDIWRDIRDPLVPHEAAVFSPTSRSEWRSEYVTVSGFYDFSKVTMNMPLSPILNFSWDIPFKILSSQDFAKTHKIALGIELHF